MKRALLLYGLTLLLSACALAPPHEPAAVSEQAWRMRQAALAALTAWSFEGRIGVTLGEKGWHAGLNWQQYNDGYDIRILAPLGQGAGWLHGDAGGVLLRTPDHKETRAADAESLLYAQFGWWAPVDGLRYWLRGLPDPGQPAVTTFDQYGRLTQLTQADWGITFTRYARVGDLELPDRLTLSNAKIRVKLVIDSWRKD